MHRNIIPSFLAKTVNIGVFQQNKPYVDVSVTRGIRYERSCVPSPVDAALSLMAGTGNLSTTSEHLERSLLTSPLCQQSDAEGKVQMSASLRTWSVVGWNGTKKIYEQTFRHSEFSDKQMKLLLQRLLCRRMSEQEIVNATMRRRRGEGYGVLEVQSERTSDRFIMSVGDTPHFTAVVLDINT
nr:hypothetical protein [uncultured Shimia sp.]